MGIDLLDELVPKFFYASHYDRMSGQIAVNKLATDRQQGRVDVGDKIFLDFLELSGTSLQELQSSKKYEDLVAKCEAASNEITEQIFNYWKQNDALEVKLDFTEARPGEHVPPKCLFPEGNRFRKSLVKVPSCAEHNSGKSTDDELLRWVIRADINEKKKKTG